MKGPFAWSAHMVRIIHYAQTQVAQRAFQKQRNSYQSSPTFLCFDSPTVSHRSHNMICILVPRGRAPFGQHQESRPLASSNDIPFLNGFVNTIDWDQNQSDLSNLTLNMRRVTGSPWIADFQCWTWPEVAILGADQMERGLCERECIICVPA